MRTLASIAKAAIEAFSDRHGGSWISGGAQPYQRGNEPHALPLDHSDHTARSLIGEIELKAHYHRAELKRMAFPLDGAVIATAHSFERRVLGRPTGVYDGVVVLSTRWEPPLLPWLCHRIRDWTTCELASFRVVGPGLALAPAAQIVSNRVMAALMSARMAREVMPIDDGVAQRLEQRARDETLKSGREPNDIHTGQDAFRFASGTTALSHPDPLYRPFGKFARIERFVAAQPRPYRASLLRPDGRLNSVASGFIDGDLALVAYQLYLRADRALSLILRASLIRRLVDEGARSLGFIGGAAGPLLRDCETAAAAELLIIGNTRAARLRQRAYLLAQPMGRIARLSAELAAASKVAAPPVPSRPR